MTNRGLTQEQYNELMHYLAYEGTAVRSRLSLTACTEREYSEASESALTDIISKTDELRNQFGTPFDGGMSGRQVEKLRKYLQAEQPGTTAGRRTVFADVARLLDQLGPAENTQEAGHTADVEIVEDTTGDTVEATRDEDLRMLNELSKTRNELVKTRQESTETWQELNSTHQRWFALFTAVGAARQSLETRASEAGRISESIQALAPGSLFAVAYSSARASAFSEALNILDAAEADSQPDVRLG